MAAKEPNKLPKLNVEILDNEDQKSGLYGRVYRGRQTDVDRIVAVKVMKNEWPGAADALQHAKVLARVDSHENIVSVYGVGTVEIPGEGGEVDAIVMEWIDGTPLFDRLGQEDFSREQAIKLVEGICDGIQHMHSLEVAHHDLNYGNVMVLEDCTIKIIDIDANRDNTLGRLSSVSRRVAIQNDESACREMTMAILRKSGLNVNKLADLNQKLSNCGSFSEVKEAAAQAFAARIDVIAESNDAISESSTLSENVLDFIENDRPISLQKLVVAQTKAACKELVSDRFTCQSSQIDGELIRSRISDYESLLEPILSVLAPGAYWGKNEHQKHWSDAVESLANIYEEQGISSRSGMSLLLELRCYPPLVALYVAGFAGWLNERFDTLHQLLCSTTYVELERREPLPFTVFLWKARNRDLWNNYVLDGGNRYVPISEHLLELVKRTVEPLTSLNKSALSDAFDDFEYFCGLVGAYGDGKSIDSPDSAWGLIGRFIWNHGTRRGGESKGVEFAERFNDPQWKALQSGFFGGQHEHFKKTIQNFEHFCGRVRTELRVF